MRIALTILLLLCCAMIFAASCVLALPPKGGNKEDSDGLLPVPRPTAWGSAWGARSQNLRRPSPLAADPLAGDPAARAADGAARPAMQPSPLPGSQPTAGPVSSRRSVLAVGGPAVVLAAGAIVIMFLWYRRRAHVRRVPALALFVLDGTPLAGDGLPRPEASPTESRRAA
jgi:hypothetical protein